MQLADRNRIDLRGLPAQFTWRYRNRLTLLRSFEVHHLGVTPYGEVEFFYDCKTGEWTHYTYSFGGFVRFSPKIEFDTAYKRQVDIVAPFANANIVRLKLLLFFHNFGN